MDLLPVDRLRPGGSHSALRGVRRPRCGSSSDTHAGALRGSRSLQLRLAAPTLPCPPIWIAGRRGRRRPCMGEWTGGVWLLLCCRCHWHSAVSSIRRLPPPGVMMGSRSLSPNSRQTCPTSTRAARSCEEPFVACPSRLPGASCNLKHFHRTSVLWSPMSGCVHGWCCHRHPDACAAA